MDITEKTGKIVNGVAVDASDKLMITTRNGITIRMEVEGIREANPPTQRDSRGHSMVEVVVGGLTSDADEDVVVPYLLTLLTDDAGLTVELAFLCLQPLFQKRDAKFIMTFNTAESAAGFIAKAKKLGVSAATCSPSDFTTDEYSALSACLRPNTRRDGGQEI
jgi:hypothetical protein